MTQPPEVAETVAQWLTKADEDLRAARHLLSIEAACPFGIICYLTQQCAEKSVKAVLTANAVSFAKTHDIAELCAMLPNGLSLGISAEDQDLLTDYATTTRYPGDAEPPGREDAEHAIAAAHVALLAASALVTGRPWPPATTTTAC